MDAAIILLPRGHDVPVEFRSIIVGVRSGSPVCHAKMGIRGRATGGARTYRDCRWFQVDIGTGDLQWWTAGNTLSDEGRRPRPILDGRAA